MKGLKKVLILGADGFIGSNLARALKKDRRYKILAFDLFKDGVSRNLSDAFDDNLEMRQGNFLNRDDLKKALVNVEYVFHFVSLTTPGSSMNDPLIDIDTNVRGTIALLDECVLAKVKRVIFSSSGGSIYGNQEKRALAEHDGTYPVSPYAISKLIIERYLEYYKIQHGLDYLIFRYANPYGPGQNIIGSQGIISIFLNLVRQDRAVVVFGNGKNIRDYIYIDDLTEITKRMFDKKVKFNTYNLGSGQGASVNNIIETIQEVVGKKVFVESRPERSIDVKRIILNIERIKSEVEYVPKVSLKEGIKKTWRELSNSE